jgi:hypothetical protein
MNNETINYAYLAGMMESEMRFLAFDEKFIKMKDHNDRLEYVKDIIERAHTKAHEFEAQMSSR